MNGRNGIMMPLGALVTAFVTVLVIGFVYNQLTPGPATQNPAAGPQGSSTAQAGSTSTSNVITSIVPQDSSASKPAATGGGQVEGDAGNTPGNGSASVNGGSADAPTVYRLHLDLKQGVVGKLSTWKLALTAKSAGQIVTQMTIMDADPIAIPGPIDMICLATTPPRQLVYQLDGAVPFYPTKNEDCVAVSAPPSDLNVSASLK